MINRRTLLVTAGASALFAWPAQAARPVAAITVGDIKITTFSDGHLNLPANMFAPQIDAVERASALKAAGQHGATVISPLNVTLIETPDEKILIDAGSGSRFMSTAGKLVEGLEVAGVAAEAITKMVFTHAHPDHLWGTINDFDELSFPNAAYYISEAEWNFWMADDVLSKLPKNRHGFAVGAQRHLNAVKATLQTVKPGGELVAGVHLIATPGHTPGHMSIEVGTGADAVVVLGDALTHPVISFAYPTWRPESDQEPDVAVVTRQRLLAKLAADGNRIIGYHLPAPGTGRVVRKGNGFAFAKLA